MKRFLLLICLAVLPLFAAGQDYQAPEVKVSTEKVRIGEKLFLVHKVEPRQTVFSICKAYGITSGELTESNPSIKDGLKTGAILYIPIKGADETPEKGKETDTAQQENDTKAAHHTDGDGHAPLRVLEHKVRLFESAKSIARKYGIDVDDLLDYNGLRLRDITPGTILLIPIRKEADLPDEPETPGKDDGGEKPVVGQENPDNATVN